MICVVGSGPAGVMCAAALIGRGLDVTLVDCGFDLEDERRRDVERLSQLPTEDWPEDSIRRIRDATAARTGGVPLKLAYGSDYPYRDVEQLTPFVNQGTATRPTLARGGFSSVWGAAVLPHRQRRPWRPNCASRCRRFPLAERTRSSRPRWRMLRPRRPMRSRRSGYSVKSPRCRMNVCRVRSGRVASGGSPPT